MRKLNQGQKYEFLFSNGNGIPIFSIAVLKFKLKVGECWVTFDLNFN